MVAILDSAAARTVTPLGFLNDRGRGDPTGDFAYQVPVGRLLRHAHGKRRVDPWSKGIRVSARLHGMGDVKRYNARMAAVEYAIEHDDGQSMRALDKADVILVAPSRCGKTPTTMYLALQHGIFVANYPLVDEDFASAELPRPVQGLRDRCFGLTTTAARLSQVRNRTKAQLPLCLARTVHVRTAPGRGNVPQSSPSRDQLLGQVRGGDVHSDLANPESENLRRRGAARTFEYVDHCVVRGPRPRRSRPGGRQERLAGRDGAKPYLSGGTRTGRLRDDCRCLPEVHLHGSLAEMINAELAALDPDDVEQLALVGRRIRDAVARQSFRNLEADIRAATLGWPKSQLALRMTWCHCGAVQCDGRGPAGCLVRRSAGDVSQCQRYRRHPGGDQRGLCVSLQRSRDRLSSSPRVRSRSRRIVCRCAADGAIRPRGVWSDVHDGHRVWLQRCGLPDLVLWSG